MQKPAHMSFTALAQVILRDAKILDEYIHDKGLPTPSTDPASPPLFQPSGAAATAAQASLLAALHKLNHLAQGPASAWLGTMNGAAGDAMTTAAVYHFNIADHVPTDTAASFEEVAEKCGMHLRDFKMIVRYAMTNFIFQEPLLGFIAHTAASQALKENKLIRALTGMGSNELYPGLFKELEALQKHPGSQEPGESAWALANNAQRPLFEELATQHPERATNMSFAMESLASMIPDSVATDQSDWAALGTALVVDVGGGKGLACQALARHFPDLKFIVQDLAATASSGRAQCPPELLSRISYTTHDFFTPQPVVGADVYFLRAIMHDWPDKYCVRILQALVPAMRTGSRVIVHDPHTPDPKTMGWWAERQARASNLRMKVFFNSHDREAGEWEGLFTAADERFRVASMKVHARDPGNEFGAQLIVVEAVWMG